MVAVILIIVLCVVAGSAAVAALVYRRFPVHKIYRSKIHLESSFDSIDDPVAVVNDQFRVVRANRAYATFVDRPITALHDQHCYALLRGRDEPCADCRLTETLESKRRQYVSQSPHPRKGGGSISLTFFPFWTRKGTTATPSIVEHVRDTTELEQLKANLERKNRLLEQTTEELTDAQATLYQEIDLARQVQQNIFPKTIPPMPGIRIALTYHPIESIGGDFYDFIPLSETRLGIFIGDASGHGLPAAFVSTLAKMSLYYCAKNDLQPADLLTAMNLDLARNIRTGHYLTCFYGIFDTATNLLTFARAGHPKPLVIGADGATEVLKSPGTLLGILESYRFQQETYQCRLGDRLYLFTDGVFVATIDKGVPQQAFDANRFHEIVGKHNHLPYSEVIPAISEELSHFVYEDDYTLIVIEVTGDGHP
jgi:sigma-B regulation protein RsbU (phosphoserine phosphatase)